MASHPDSTPKTNTDQPDSFEPGLGGAGTDARLEGEAPWQADEAVSGKGGTTPPDSPGDFGGTAGTGGVDEVQEMLDR